MILILPLLNTVKEILVRSMNKRNILLIWKFSFWWLTKVLMDKYLLSSPGGRRLVFSNTEKDSEMSYLLSTLTWSILLDPYDLFQDGERVEMIKYLKSPIRFINTQFILSLYLMKIWIIHSNKYFILKKGFIEYMLFRLPTTIII